MVSNFLSYLIEGFEILCVLGLLVIIVKLLKICFEDLIEKYRLNNRHGGSNDSFKIDL